MTGLDTNVLVRYVMQDDAAQSKLASELMDSLTERDMGFIALVALTELVWVLTACYNLKRLQIVEVVTALLQSRELTMQDSDAVLRAVRRFENGNADFADCLIEVCGAAAGCRQTVTFDSKAAKSAGMSLLSA